MSMLWPIVKAALANLRRVACIDDQRRYTYAQLLGGSLFLAEKIDATSSRPHVGIILPTGGMFPMALLAAWMSKRVAVPFNYLLSKDELAYVIADSEVDAIITVKPMLEFIGGREMIPPHIKLILLEETDFTGVPPLRWPPCAAADDLAIILYTSGTSGRPKGVMLTHGNLRINVQDCIVHAELTSADGFLGVLPQFHSFGLTALTLLPLYLGSRVIYTARFIPKKIISLIREHRPDIFMAVPSMYGAMLAVKNTEPADFASIRLPISGGEPLPAAVYDEFHDRLKMTILEGYGLTETSPVSHWSTPRHHRLKAVGRALPHVSVLIVDEKDQPQPVGSEGEILLAGPNIMPGYFKLPQQTNAVFTSLELPDAAGGAERRRWFRTGDIGKIDAEGYLYITGRKKEMLIIAGENVFPREIEEVLNKHPMIHDSAVIGKMDGLRGEIPIAFVELAEGATFEETELRTWCRDRLAQFKVPREIRVMEKLPRNPTGKIMRRSLKA